MIQKNIAISCENVKKSFFIKRDKVFWKLLIGDRSCKTGELIEALRNITMKVNRGEIVGVLGKNGAGKSTLLRLLGHVYSPTSGTINIQGKVIGLFELGGLGNPHLTGREYAIRYLTFVGVKSRDLQKYISYIADFSELNESFDHKIRTYSSGMAARLYFSVATAHKEEIYLIDELLSVGDEHFQAKSWRRMRELLHAGASGVLVTHDWTSIIKLCKHSCLIENGELTFQGKSDAAVVRYLNLPIEKQGAAKFADELPSVFVLMSTENSIINIPIEIIDDASVECSISVEMLRIGIGWEIILLSEQIPVGDSLGKYNVEFSIPNLPLVQGEYSLNLFLSQCSSDKSNNRTAADVRSWTYGNGLKLVVEGNENNLSCVKLPFVASGVGSR